MLVTYEPNSSTVQQRCLMNKNKTSQKQRRGYIQGGVIIKNARLSLSSLAVAFKTNSCPYHNSNETKTSHVPGRQRVLGFLLPRLLFYENGLHLRPITLISSVHTRRIQTLSLPWTPSTSSSSIPSHQHLLAGFLQNSSSFCAMPIAALFMSVPRMSLRNLVNARLQMTALFGSPARWPQ